MKTKETMRFLPLKNNSVTIGLNFLLDFISVIISSNTINTLFSLLDYNLVNFHKRRQFFVNNAFGFFKFLIPTFSLPLISI